MGEMADFSLDSQTWPEDCYWPNITQRGGETSMAIIEVGMTLDDAKKSVEPIPAAKYRGTLVDWMKDKEGNVLQKTRDGKKKIIKPIFKVVHEDPAVAGRQLIYNAVVGSFSFGELAAALPQCFVGRGIDTEAGKGSDVWLDVSIGTYDGRDRNQIDHISHIAAN
jgi:hypothetical protein